MLNLVIRHDKTLAERFLDGSVATSYTSKDIQNEMLHVLTAMVRSEILENVKSSKYFSVLSQAFTIQLRDYIYYI